MWNCNTKAGSEVSEEDYLQGIAGHVGDLDPGKTASFEATLQPDTYEMAYFGVVNLGGRSMVNSELGMHAVLTVR
jgi:hypothetical protein